MLAVTVFLLFTNMYAQASDRSGSSWQPGQMLMVFWLVDDYSAANYVVNYTGNITQGKLDIWADVCLKSNMQF